MTTNDPNLRGVGGWLAFFLVTLGIVNPAVFAFSGYAALSDPQLPAAYGEVWPTLRNAEIGIIVFILATLWFATWRFLNVFNQTTVWIGIGTLWTLALVGVLGETIIVSRIAGIAFGDLMAASTGPELIRPFVYATVWTAYLLRSERVRNTYGEGATGEAAAEVFE